MTPVSEDKYKTITPLKYFTIHIPVEIEILSSDIICLEFFVLVNWGWGLIIIFSLITSVTSILTIFQVPKLDLASPYRETGPCLLWLDCKRFVVPFLPYSGYSLILNAGKILVKMENISHT